MNIKLIRPLKLDSGDVKEIDLKLEDLTGSDILKVDLEIRADGDPRGFDNIYNQKVLLTLASKASGIFIEDLEKLSAPDFLEVTFTVRNFLMGLLDEKVEPKTSEESLSN